MSFHEVAGGACSRCMELFWGLFFLVGNFAHIFMSLLSTVSSF